jgi:hypothetical protein
MMTSGSYAWSFFAWMDKEFYLNGGGEEVRHISFAWKNSWEVRI